MSCSCVDVEMGTYGNQITVAAPAHITDYRRRCNPNLRPLVSLDVCVADEVQELWKRGITTTGCCCGHNKQPPYIGVLPEDCPAMTALGYRPFPGVLHHFVPKRLGDGPP